jgi:hypothetical protein
LERLFAWLSEGCSRRRQSPDSRSSDLTPSFRHFTVFCGDFKSFLAIFSTFHSFFWRFLKFLGHFFIFWHVSAFRNDFLEVSMFLICFR